jgi:predicted permease
MSALQIAVRIFPIFLILGIGAGLRGLKAADDGWVDALNRYGLCVGFPAVVIDNLSRIGREEILRNLAVYRLNVILILGIVVCTLAAVKALRLKEEIANSYVVSVFFGNIAYMGYPIVTSVFANSQGELSVLIAIYVVTLFTLGVALLEASKARGLNAPLLILTVVRNPLLVASLVGTLIVFTGSRLPPFIHEALAMLKASASPVVIISLGIFMVRRFSLRRILSHVIVLSLLRVAVVPLVFYAAGRALHLFPSFAVSVVEAGMPLGVTPFALASMYPLEKDVLGSAVVLSTLLSVASLPVLMSIVI